jgi:predicted methyltransferase
VTVGSAPYERSNLVMRRLKYRSKSTMNEDKLVGVALLFIHRDQKVSISDILDRLSSNWTVKVLEKIKINQLTTCLFIF